MKIIKTYCMSHYEKNVDGLGCAEFLFTLFPYFSII